MTFTEESNASPKVTCLMAVKNGMPYLSATLESIRNQTYTNWEMLVWDNGSTDGTLEELSSWIPSRMPGRVIVDRPLPLGQSRAEMVSLCTTELIAITDADDLSVPDRLETQVNYLTDHPEIALYGSTYDEIDQQDNSRGITWPIPADHEDIVYTMLFRNVIMQPSVMFRRSAVLASGNYRHLDYVEDFDLWLRLITKFKTANLMRPLIKYRVHPKGTTLIGTNQNRVVLSAGECLDMNAPALYGCSPAVMRQLRQHSHPDPIKPIRQIARHLSATQGGIANKFRSPTFLDSIFQFMPLEDAVTRRRISLLRNTRRILFVSLMKGQPWKASEELWSSAAMELLKEGHTVGVNFPTWPEQARQLHELESAGATMQWRYNPTPPPPPPPPPAPPPRSTAYRIVRRVARELGIVPFPKPPAPPRPPEPSPSIEYFLQTFAPDLVLIAQEQYTDGWEWMSACRTMSVAYCPLTHRIDEQSWPDDAGAFRRRLHYENAWGSFWESAADLESARWQMATHLTNAKVVTPAVTVRPDANPDWPEVGEFRLACIGPVGGGTGGHDILFDVLRHDKWKARPLKVTVFSDSAMQKSLVAWQDMYCIDSIVFGGNADDTEKTWANHHGLIVTPRVECAPSVIIDAMLCNRMCIVTDVGGFAELIDDNATGFVAAAPNRAMVDEALERAWERREEWKAIGEAAGRQARERIAVPPGAELADDLLLLFDR